MLHCNIDRVICVIRFNFFLQPNKSINEEFLAQPIPKALLEDFLEEMFSIL
jgi:hypothetical protein